jgi:hypothetical protein
LIFGILFLVLLAVLIKKCIAHIKKMKQKREELKVLKEELKLK